MSLIVNRQNLMHFRSIVIQLLNALDDMLGLPRTIPAKDKRRLARRFVGEDATCVDIDPVGWHAYGLKWRRYAQGVWGFGCSRTA